MPFDAIKGITVVEAATFVTGPYAAALLAQLGSRVIKIESAPDGDPYRYFAPDPHFSFNFAHLNRNKQSIVLDLKAAAGKKIALELIQRADVFIENFRPGTADRLGLGYEKLKAANPRLIYCSISAFGATGPYADKPGFDTLGQAMSGLLSLLSDPDEPKVMGMAVSDYVTGLSAAYGILGALLARATSGIGCKVETSLLQATLSFIGETAAGYFRTGNVPNRMARVKNAHAFAFITEDDLRLAIHCSVPEKFWLALLKATDRMDLADDPRFSTREGRRQNYEELENTLAATFRSRSRADWMERLEANDVPVSPLYDMAEVLDDPQVRHLRLIEEVAHPDAGKLKFIGAPVRYEGLAQRSSKPPPLVGEHSAEILKELGYDSERIHELVARKVIQLRGRGH